MLSQTTLAHSNDLFFRERLPWRLGLVRLDAGATLMLHLHGDVPDAPARVKVGARLDRAGQAVLIAFPDKETENMADDPMLREMGCDPRFRKVLVTDGKSAVGQALVQALAKAGADLIWVGHAEPWKKLPGVDAIAALPQVTLVPLDLTNGRSVSASWRAPSPARWTSSSTTPRCTARRAWPAGAAPTWPAPRWTSTTSERCAWLRSSAPHSRAAAPTARATPSPG